MNVPRSVFHYTYRMDICPWQCKSAVTDLSEGVEKVKLLYA